MLNSAPRAEFFPDKRHCKLQQLSCSNFTPQTLAWQRLWSDWCFIAAKQELCHGHMIAENRILGPTWLACLASWTTGATTTAHCCSQEPLAIKA